MDDNKSNQNNSAFDENCWIKGYSKVFQYVPLKSKCTQKYFPNHGCIYKSFDSL